MTGKRIIENWKYAVLGAVAFWVPSLAFYLKRANRFSGIDVVILSALLPIITCCVLAIALARIRRDANRRVAVISAIAGVWIFGPLMMTIGWSSSGAGFSKPDGLAVALIGTALFPLMTLMMATYDGTLFGVILTSVFLPLLPRLPFLRVGDRKSAS